MNPTNPARTPKRTSRRGILPGCLLAAGLVAILLVLAAAGIYILGRTGLHEAERLGTVVVIQAPSGSEAAEVSVPIEIAASAEDPAGVTRIEVYADGVLIAEQESDGPEGTNPLVLFGQWTPLTAGRHLLTSHAYTHDGRSAESSVTFVTVFPPLTTTIVVDVDSIPRPDGTPLPSLDQIAAFLGVSTADLLALNPGLAGVDAAAPLPAGTQLVIPRPPALPPASGFRVRPGGHQASLSPSAARGPLLDPPAPPTDLAVTGTCNVVHITWTASPSAGSYRIDMLIPGGTSFQQSGAVDGTFRSQPISILGEYSIRVSSVGTDGRSWTPGPIVGYTTPDSCAGFTEAQRRLQDTLSLDFISLETDEALDGAYCYFQVETQIVSDRFPRGDFELLVPDFTGRVYNLTRSVPALLSIGRASAREPFVLAVQCYGARGVERILIGSFEASHPPSEWDGRVSVGSGAGFRLHYRLRVLQPAEISIEPGEVPGPIVPRFLTDLPVPTNLRIGSGIQACDEIANRSARGACVIAGLLGLGAPTLTWDWTGTSLWTESNINGYRVTARRTDLATGEVTDLFTRDIHPGSRKATLAPNAGFACGQRISFTVTAVATDPGLSAPLESAESEPVYFDTPACQSWAEVYVHLISLDVGPVNDVGDICLFCPARDERLEVSGRYTYTGNSNNLMQSTGYIGNNPTLFPMFAGIFRFDDAYPPFILDGTEAIRDATTPIVITLHLNEGDGFGPPFGTYDRITPWCFVDITVPGRSLAEWRSLDQDFTARGGTDEASCLLTVHVQGLPER